MQENGFLKVWGANNSVTVIERGIERPLDPQGIPGLAITINGNNNRVRIEMPLRFSECQLALVGNNNFFSIRSSHKTRMLRVFFYIADGCAIEIGKNCYINNNASFIAKEKAGTKIVVGNDCVIAADCLLRCGDGHTLINEFNGQPLNEPDDIILEDHVWVGARCVLLKRAYVAENSVVGTMSLVNKRFDIPNVLIAGVPAKIIKSGIDWDLADYKTYVGE
ncbi:MAG: acyltransferase [Alphaproteobacteria bacterium]|nr:acyltransferase [Alphaproteobacteria bacterium]